MVTSPSHVTVTEPHVSLTVTLLGSGGGALPTTVQLVGQVIVGGVVSLTVIVCVKFVLLPQVSAADQVRLMMLLHELPGLLCVWA